MNKKSETSNFWITNISNRNVSLSDLNLTIKAYSSVNLLDNKHHKYTKEQILKSVASGSIYNKRDKIFVRKIPPVQPEKNKIDLKENSGIPSRSLSTYEIKHSNFEELVVDNKSEEQYAEDNAELAEMDKTH